jgi:hypothetical protein
MNVNVPPSARDHFWEEPPPGSIEFWSFRFPPPCKVGDPLVFRFDGVPVARAIVHRIEKPGLSRCERSGGFESGWKVYWLPDSFVDLRRSEPELPLRSVPDARFKTSFHDPVDRADGGAS